MRADRIQGNINFGYNQQLNKALVTKIEQAKRNKKFLDTLLKLNNLTNETETLVRQAEQDGNHSLRDKLVDNIFIYLKTLTAQNIDRFFPKLKYAETESVTYMQEAATRGLDSPENWLRYTADNLAVQGNSGKDVLNIVVPKGMTPEEFIKILGLDSEAAEIKARGEAEKILAGSECVREYIPTEFAKLGFASLGGMQDLKKMLNERIVNALKNPAQAKADEEEYGKQILRRVLLYGPPGCGKTTIAEHLSTEAGVPLLKLEAGTLGSSYIHETSARIDAAFDYAENMAKDKPVIVFLDDADSLLLNRDLSNSPGSTEEMSSFLNRIQKAGDNNVIFIAATNKYDLLDEAIKSRFQEQIFVDLPDKDARKSILKLFLEQRSKGKELAENDEGLESIAQKTEQFPIRALKTITEKASLAALSDGRRNIKAEDFYKVIDDSQNMKIRSENYKTKHDRKPIGYN